MQILPKKKQWKKWSFVSKVTYVSLILAVLGLIYTLSTDLYSISKESPNFSPKQEAQIQILYSYFSGEIKRDHMMTILQSMNVNGNIIEFTNALKLRDTLMLNLDIGDKKFLKELNLLELTGFSGVLEYRLPNNSKTIYVRTCKDYRNYLKYGYDDTTLGIKADSYFFSLCNLFELLNQVRPPEKSYMMDKEITEIDFWSLELAGLDNFDADDIDENDKAEVYVDYTEPNTFRHFLLHDFVEIVDVRKNAITINSKDRAPSTVTYLELLRGDFNKDGIEDIVVDTHYFNYRGGSIGWSDLEIWTMYEHSKHFERIYKASLSRVP